MNRQYTIDCFADISTEEACKVLLGKLDLDQTSVARTHTGRHKCDKTHFSVANLGFIRLIGLGLDVSDEICDPKWRLDVL